jgi:hypothetical protein
LPAAEKSTHDRDARRPTVMTVQEAFWNWLRPWIAVGIGLTISIVFAVLIAALSTSRKKAD